MDAQQQAESQAPSQVEIHDGKEMLVAGAISLVVNLGFLLIAKGDQRMILLLILTTVVGLVLLITPKGAYGMGAILGAIVAVIIALCLAGFAHWSPLTSNGPSAPPPGKVSGAPDSSVTLLLG
ncbi:MAG TPA: hypothetical protein VFE15_01060 [Marmoricola sp.]|jgi:hypothetical protein|nr:hypothetical protein [Marmoricola sp.]